MKKEKMIKLQKSLETLHINALKAEKKYKKQLRNIHYNYQDSARNLLHYLSLRHSNTGEMQTLLAQLGLSRLAKAEAHVLASIHAVEKMVKMVLKEKTSKPEKPPVTIKKGNKRIRNHTDRLLGKKRKGSSVRIMVTLPSEAGDDYKLVHDLVNAGMNSARINCAHDDVTCWKRMVEHVKKARKKTGRSCFVCMDLGGPKLRTGLIEPGPSVIHLQPKRDMLGSVVTPATVCLTGPGTHSPDHEMIIPVADTHWLKNIRSGVEISFTDVRGKLRQLQVTAFMNGKHYARCYNTAYITPGTELSLACEDGNVMTTKVDMFPAREQTIELKQGDLLTIHKKAIPGKPARYDAEGRLLYTAHISCTLPEIFNDVKPGEPILMDDGKIEGIIRKVNPDEMQVEITYAKNGLAKLRGDKGINLPESNLRVKGLTERDKKDLEFIAEHADVVNMSFVNDAQDVQDLIDDLDRLKAEKLGIILKIETKSGFKNLPAILLKAMQRPSIGVMLARGDLAIEAGWNHLAKIQEEILWLCEAAHIPIVWATQVLETLAKKGRPSRAEITDAAIAQRAECVMLNKGPHIVETIKMLDDIMTSMEVYHLKKAPLIPTLKTTDFLNLD